NGSILQTIMFDAEKNLLANRQEESHDAATILSPRQDVYHAGERKLRLPRIPHIPSITSSLSTLPDNISPRGFLKCLEGDSPQPLEYGDRSSQEILHETPGSAYADVFANFLPNSGKILPEFFRCELSDPFSRLATAWIYPQVFFPWRPPLPNSL